MKIKWLSRRIASPGPYLTLCTSEAQFRQALKDCSTTSDLDWIRTPHADATVHHLQNKSNERVCIVCVRPKPESTAIEIAGLLIHEAIHVWQDYCDRIGEHSPGREQEAYGVQSIAQELLQAYSDEVAK